MPVDANKITARLLQNYANNSLCVLIPRLPDAQADIQRSDTKQSLRGLKSFYVFGQVVDEHLDDLTTNDINKLVTSRLAAAGITADAAPDSSNGDPNLSVTVDTIRQPQLDIYAFTVEVAVTQDVRLNRPGHFKGICAVTWRRTLQGITSPDRTDVIQQALKQCLDVFIEDYQTVNPNGK